MKNVIKISFFILLFQNLNAIKNKNEIKLTIKQAVKMAYKHQSSLKAKKFATQASKENEKGSLTGYFPQVNFKTSQSYSKGSKGLHSNTSIEASQLVYSFAGPLEKYKIAKKGTAITEYNKQTHKDLIRFQVESSFLQSWLLQRKNKFIKSLNKSSLDTFNKSLHQNKLNLLNKNDWLNQAAIYAQNISTVYLYTDELNNALNELEFLIGKQLVKNNKKINFVWNPKKKVILKNLNYYINLGISNRKEIKQKQKEVEQQEENKKFYKKSCLPNLNINGNAGRGEGTSSASIGINISWNISDGGTNFYESRKSNANRLKALMEKNYYIQQAKYDIKKAYNELLQYLKQLKAKNIRLAQSKNELNLQKLKLDIGEISQIDFEQTRLNWETEKFNWLTIKVNLSIKECELMYSCGYPQI
ncbi:TolC family protein [Candidatus Babeliales bacterium]|nr:TolC family protein [Candidatus Babeliales bacterium]